jgi:hypothetical protein
MALECNIDAAGKYVRLLLGISTIIVSIPLVLITVFGVIDQTLGLVVLHVGGRLLCNFRGFDWLVRSPCNGCKDVTLSQSSNAGLLTTLCERKDS